MAPRKKRANRQALHSRFLEARRRVLLASPEFSNQPEDGEDDGQDPEKVEKTAGDSDGHAEDDPKDHQKNGKDEEFAHNFIGSPTSHDGQTVFRGGGRKGSGLFPSCNDLLDRRITIDRIPGAASSRRSGRANRQSSFASQCDDRGID